MQPTGKTRPFIGILKLRFWCDCIGHLSLIEIHQATIQPHLETRREQGISSNTAKRALSTLTKVLTTAHTIYREEWHQLWLLHVPKFVMPSWSEPRKPHPISLEEQDCLLSALCGSLRDIALFALHTGLRAKELTHLSWADELPSQQGCLIFRLPAEYDKNGCSRLVVCNCEATQVVEACRGDTQVYIFEHHEGKARRRISGGMGWKAGKGRAVKLLEGTTGRTAASGFK